MGSEMCIRDSHLDEEEHEVFKLAGKALSEGQKERLGDKYNDAMH